MSLYLQKLKELKVKRNFLIPVSQYGKINIQLRVIARNDLKNTRLIAKLTRWRNKNNKWYPSQFVATKARTRAWLEKLVIGAPDRILFAIEDGQGKMYGHLGFYRYDPRHNTCELDNVLRGVWEIPGLMTKCVNVLTSWGRQNLGVAKIYLTVFLDNQRAVNLYRRCGFVDYKKIGLVKVLRDDEARWESIPSGIKRKPQRFFLKMKLAK